MENLSQYFFERSDRMVADLRALVEIESPSSEKAAVDRVGSCVAEKMGALGAKVTIHPCQNTGDCVTGSWFTDVPGAPISLLAHMDTVWPLGTLALRPVRTEGETFYGPGALDMKAGIIIALTALRGMAELGLRPTAPITLVCTGDEEIGSRESRKLVEAHALQSRLVLCVEPSIPGGALKTERKGTGSFRVRAVGRAAHSGMDHEKGINAIAEMARHILALQSLTDYNLGTTVNVGKIRGGIATNVVPETCEALVEFRITRTTEARRLFQAAADLKPHHPEAQVEVDTELNRPPMPKNAQMAATFAKARTIARRHGWSLEDGSVGGASDANFTAALKVPTLDGLGADGDGFHSPHEHVLISSLPQRAALLTALLSEWDA